MRTPPQRAVVLAALTAVSCRGTPEPRDGDRVLSADEIRRCFAEVAVGQTREEVETALGAPLNEVRQHTELPSDATRAWYLGYRIEGLAAPYMPGAIEITYGQGRVVGKRLNPQVR